MVQHQFESFSPRHGDVIVVVDFNENKRNLKLQLISKSTDAEVLSETLRTARGVESYLHSRNIIVPPDVIDALEEDVEEASMFGVSRRVVLHEECTLH